ncbi:LytTR family transcriptional regulator [Sulfitobacter sp. M57]|uniref:LytTR family DNA-binding domain-containing protein n=1 Tax=unclassified Sulfitobacter TaxID=196795 RepID=UPI0023E14937|nr:MULTISPECIES: LytTR family DNA-binding domain-containing protein [unclassified Sulfitobacter]MDF3412962.1 LytTR family transcriptional regulator [Sulfitobacter sp. KE5]MDF3421754.1 LytTR family transcriptional regulator [Sulfitobacter sp. KE43]MDF3431511.1 LytTR family transcriptional regulator [Sulfitobacter sp. KE42]MDF3457152.1 LytTR family transcriptional regulator [Sulfitobacter sp. S74]MDF3461055.1 LytTR family transcriptional regulator [Sulfitobacter sp. Ks18]
MGKIWNGLQLALREKQGLMIPVAIWGMATLICAVAGPFGTLEALGLWARTAYWAVVIGVSVGFSTLLSRMTFGTALRYLISWSLFVVGLGSLVWGINAVVFPGWQDAVSLFQLLVYVAVVSVLVHGVFFLIDLARPVPVETAGMEIDPQTRFLRRLPLAERGPLVRIEAQDHYLKVVTDRGSTLILLRLSEAVEELANVAGLQVHRSHWVALEAVTAHRREKGRDLLVLSDGAEVPVSRSNRAAAQEAGLF